MKRISVFLSMATMLVALGAPLSAQTIHMKANVPFEFMVSGHTLPAGDYTISTVSTFGPTTLRVSSGNSGLMAFANISGASRDERNGKAVLIFHRYGDQYFLSRIVNGYSASSMELPVSRTEKEVTKTASLGNYETVAILASL